MEQKKHPLKSKTIVASLLMLIVGLLTATGTISGAQAEIIKDIGPELLTGIIMSVLSIVTVYGRVTAKTGIGKAE